MPKWHRVRNKLDQTTLIPDGALTGYLSRGWVLDDEDDAKPAPEPEPEQEEPVSETEPDVDDVEETD